MRPLTIMLIAAAALLAVPAGASAALAGEERDDVFRITGDAADDRVAAVANGTSIAFDFDVDGTLDEQVRMDDISSVAVDLGAGKDQFNATGNLATEQWSVNGGPGDDALLGTNGVDALVGGSGGDAIDGQQGADAVAGGTGADTFTWDPGDGNEVTDGGGDSDLDTLRFNGSNIGEIYTINADGTGVRFTRNIGNIVMDLRRIDLVDLATLGGADSVTADGVGSLTQLRIDTGADTDTVATGNGSDRIVGGADADNLDGGVGDDRIFGGPGADQVFGRGGDDGIEGGEDVDAVNGGANVDGCTDGGDAVSECESTALPADLEPRPFPHPLEPEEPPVTDPGPQDPEPTDPGTGDPGDDEPAPVAGFAIDRVRTDRRGLRVAIDGTGAEAVEVEVAATERVKRAGRRGKRTVTYAAVTRTVAAGETATVRLKAPKRHRATLANAAKRKVTATVTNVTNGISETEEIRGSR